MKGYKIVVYKVDGDYLSEGVMTFIDDKDYRESSAGRLARVAIKRAVDILEDRRKVVFMREVGG